MAQIVHMVLDSFNSHLSNGGNQPEHNNNPLMFVLFVIFSVSMSISLLSAREIVQLIAAICALIPAGGGAILWIINNKHKFKKK